MSTLACNEDPVIIDLTGGISASTSPMQSPPPRPRSEAGKVLCLPADSSDDEKDDTPPAPAKNLNNISSRGKKRMGFEESDDEDNNDVNLNNISSRGKKRMVFKESNDEDNNAVKDDSDKKMQAKTTASSPKTEQTYLKARRAGVKKRSFDLSRISRKETIPTGRTIKRMPAWSGHWPALREFMQNTIDHLGLLDPKTGRRHEALQLRISTGTSPNELATFRFVCGQEPVCTIIASPDELVIDQFFTFPIAPRALDTGVPDTEKSSATSAGGFGDGFKTAAVALLALGKDFESLKWHFFADGRRIDWSFEGATRAAVGTFARCQVLQVCITRAEQSASDEKCSNTHENLMRQVIKVRNIGKSFVEQAVPRLTVFWDLDASTLVSSSKSGGDFIGPASVQPAIGGGVLGSKLRPESGVYVKGIWVRKAKIAGTLMCFFGRRLEVNGRDRNDVDDDDLIGALVYIFRHCNDPEHLRLLLSPLKGKSAVLKRKPQASHDCSSSSTRTRTGSHGGNGDSWLLKSPRFLNHILEQYKDFILHEIMGVPRGAVYVGSKTTKSSDPFVSWASEFLPKVGCPLEPIEPGANRYLFQEITEFELVERCVDVLKRQNSAHKHSELLSKAFRKVLTFMGLRHAKAVFSPHVAVAFVHKRSIYAPEAPLTRELLIKVLNVCQSHLDGADGERFSSLMQAAFETLPPGSTRTLTSSDIDEAIKKAKAIQKDNNGFLVNPGSRGGSGNNNGSSSSTPRDKPIQRTVTPEAIDLTADRGSEGNGSNKVTAGEGRKIHATTGLPDLESQIARVSRAAETSEARRKRKRGGGGGEEDDELPPIIPPSDFGRDDAGTDSCLRPSSQLRSVEVDEALGGGALLCDPSAAGSIGRLGAPTKARISDLRRSLEEARRLVLEAIPSLGPLLRRVRHGYDSSNDTYEAFCDGAQIVVNLHAYLPKLPRALPAGAPRLPLSLVHDLAVTVTHELAHFLEPQEGHGPVWRDTHMRMVTEVMNYLSRNRSDAGVTGQGEDGMSSSKRQRMG